jgi:hypothetical protein
MITNTPIPIALKVKLEKSKKMIETGKNMNGIKVNISFLATKFLSDISKTKRYRPALNRKYKTVITVTNIKASNSFKGKSM